MPHNVPFAVSLPTSGGAADPGALGSLAQTAEALGFNSIWISDHVVVPEEISSSYPYSADGHFPTAATQPYLEPLSALGYLAGLTRTTRLGIAVLVLPYRHPLLTAKMIATLDTLSGGRIDLGIGVGWMREEFEALGWPAEVYEGRGRATDEQLRILKAAWTEDVFSFEGEFYRFPRLGAHPHPRQKPHPPIWVGGHSKAAIRRTARYADVWLPIGARPPADLPPEQIKALVATLRTEAERAGRDPSSLRVCFSTHVLVDAPTRDRRFSGSVEQIVADFEAYRAVGVDSFMLGFGPHPAAEYERRMRAFAENVRPAIMSVPA
ncbi:MAG: LLM class F420-dependent oxidoreductase [Chloroflexi bacterium]|nr:LLM class F420-dependent oxidoreductase [Chloroflexota bacterium]